MQQSIPAVPSHPPRATAGHLPALSLPGVGHLKILRCPAPGHLPPRASDTHAVSYQNTELHRRFVKDGKKLKRFVKACSRFYACISSLLIKPELHSETRELST